MVEVREDLREEIGGVLGRGVVLTNMPVCHLTRKSRLLSKDLSVVRYAQKSINSKNGLLVPCMDKAGNPCLHTSVTRLLTGPIGGRLKWPYGTPLSPSVSSSALLQREDNALRNHKHHVNQ